MNIVTTHVSEYKLLKSQSRSKHKHPIKTTVRGEYIQTTSVSSDQYVFKANRGRVAIFIDGSCLFNAALQLGIEIDYTKLLCYLTKNARLLRAFFYTGIDKNNEKQQGFLLWMCRNGYRVMTKDIVQLPDGSRKSNLHVEIAIDMLNLAPYYDTAVLVSGDEELAYAVNALTYKGIRVEVVSLRGVTSDSLIDVADYFIDLDTIKQHIRKDPNHYCHL